jgi:tetratricopeptide (TPR) repeat protein
MSKTHTMPQRFILSMLTFFIVNSSSASIADSLEKILPDLHGIEKVDVLNRLALSYRVTKQEKTFEFGKQAIELSGRLKYEKGAADALHNIGDAYYYISNYAMAIDYLKQSLEIYQKLDDAETTQRIRNKIATNYRMIGKYHDALTFYFELLRFNEAANDTLWIAHLSNNIGGIYRLLGDYDKALYHYQRFYDLCLITNDLAGLSKASNNLAHIYRHNKDVDRALEFYQKSLDIDLKLNNPDEVARSYNNLASIYYKDMLDYEKATELTHRSIEISTQLNNKWLQTNSYLILGQIYMAKEQFDQAEEPLEIALALSLEIGSMTLVNNVLTLLSANSKEKRDFRKATDYYTELLTVRDSIHKEQTKVLVSEIEAKYEFEKKQQEIESLIQENRIQELKLSESRFVTYSLAGLTFAILIITLLLIQRYRQHTRQKSADLEQKLFRIQMNPHFIFNSLNAIQGFIYKQDPPEAGKYLSSFARLIRLVLNNSREEFITLENEIRTLDYYLQLQRLRFDNKFDYSFDVDAAINTELIMIPPMLAQPFIENSIEHGIQHITTKGNIKISFKLSGKQIVFQVEDNGIGVNQSRIINANRTDQHESIALSIAEERLKLLNRKHPQKIELNIREINPENSEGKGTLITFNIPYQSIKTIQTG